MIEPDINERMARFAPSQNMGDAGDDAIERAVAGMAGMPARPQFEQDADIDAAVLQIAGERRQDMAASLMAASQVNPDQAARASKLGDQFGVGQDIALRNMQELEREATVRDIQRMDLMRNDPVLARYLSDRAFASEAQDDVGILAKLRPVFVEAALVAAQGPRPVLSRGYERGSAIAERGAIGTKAMVGLAQPEDLEQAKRLQQRMQSLGQMGILGTTAEMIGQNVAQLRGIGTTAVAGAGVGSFFGPAGTAVGGALGATAGVIATTAEMEAGNLYLDLQEEGVSEETAIPVAIAGGFLNGVIEVVGMKVAAKPFQALAQRVMREAVADAIKKPTMRSALAAAGKGYLMQVGAEGAEEALQETVIIAGEEIAKAIDGVDSETGMREAVDRVLESFMYGAMGASILGGIGPGANLLVDLRRASNTERQQRFFEGLAANNKESRLAQRSPVAYERFLEAQAEGAQAETIYVDGRIAQQVLAQSGVPTAQLEEILPGIRERISEAVQTGGDVTIPTARFGARLANTELGNALLPHMRLSPDAMSATEAQEFATRRQDVVREAEQILAQKQEADATFVQQARQIEDTLASQIVATGQMDEKAARSSAQFMRDFYVTQAAALGMSPQQVYERFPVRVEGAMPAAAAPLEQASRLMYPSLAKAWDRYNSGERYMTVGDLADKIESLELAGKRIPQAVLNAVQDFRNAQREEREIYGERGGTADDAGNALEIAVQNAAEELRETQPSADIMEQAAVQPRLMAVHNLSASNLVFADRMGGLAVPSIGVITEERGGVEGFGDITLIGTREMADPATSRVFSSDAYSARFPRAEWPKVASAKANKFVDQLREVAARFEDRRIIDETFDAMVNSPDAEKVVGYWLRSMPVGALFLKEKGIEIAPIMRQRKTLSGLSWESIDKLRPVYEAVNQQVAYDEMENSPEYRNLQERYADAIRSEYAAVREDLGDATIERWATGFTPTTLQRLSRDMSQADRQTVDDTATRTAIDSAMEPFISEFKSWVEAKVRQQFGEPFIRIGRSRKPYTLGNIVDVMTSPKVRGEEKGMTFGAGAARAEAAVEFVDLEQMREAAKSAIVDPDEYSKASKKSEAQLSAYRDAVIEYTKLTDWRGKSDTWAALDGSMRALATYGTRKRKDAAAMRRALAKEGFASNRIPVEIIEQAMEAAEALFNAPVPYFESKPQRAVRLGEFAGAVIPSNATQETRDILERNGVRYMTYLAGDEADRQRAVREMAQSPEARGEVLFQAPVAPDFYSALEREVSIIDAKALTASGWGERFKGLISKGAIKADELEWSGLADYLKMQEGKVSKDAVLEFLRGNGVRVERTTYTRREIKADPADIRALERSGFPVSQDPYNRDETTFFSRKSQSFVDSADIQALADQGEVSQDVADAASRVAALVRSSGPTKYEQYTLPGGRNYREVLLTLPAAPTTAPIMRKQYQLYENGELVGVGPDVASAIRWSDANPDADIRVVEVLDEQATAAAARKRGEFVSPHWAQSNVLVHLRMNDRVDADGKRVLFVEEVQSDWGQAGKKKGFAEPRPPDFDDRVTRLRTELEVASERVSATRLVLSEESSKLLAEMGLETYADILLAGDRKRELKAQYATLQEASPSYIAARQEVVEAERAEAAISDELNNLRFPGERIARAPFVETTDGWLNLGLKQVMLEAVRGNYDRVAFVTGQQSADRYDLSKQVDEVNVSRGGGTTWEIWADKDGQMVVRKDVRTIEEVEEVLGKELAAKVSDMKPGDSGRTFSGVDLKVGGEGMKSFYDKIVPIAMGKLLKKYGGGKIGSVVLPNMKQQELEADAERMGMTVSDVLDVAEESEYAQAQPGFDITPEMVTKLESGLPLFQAAAAPGPRGGFDPKRLTTILNKTADLSTFLHESAHAFLTFYEQVAATPDAPTRIVNDMDELLRWFKIDGATPAERIANWNGLTLDQKRKYHETFAYNFEVYLFEGKAPSVEMQGLFERFSAWLKRVYRSIRDDLNAIYRREFGEDLPILTGEVRQVMDRMLATDEQIKRQAAINEMKPQFQTQEQSGMDDAEWAAYQAMQQEAIEASITDMNKASMRQLQWLGNARSRILRDMQKKHDAKRKEVAAEVAAELRVEPVYRAMTYLRTGKFIDADGAEVEMEGPHRLDIKQVKAIYAGMPSEADVEPIRATGMAVPVTRPQFERLGYGKYGMLAEDGVAPDLVAETFGYSSGDQMIRALLAAKPIKEAVAERTDAEMLRRFGDMNTPEAREAEVQKALHNEARARFVAVELRHIARATEPVRVMVEAAKQVARELIAGTTVRDVRPADFIAAESRAARDASRMGTTINPVAVGQAAQTRAYNEAVEAGTDPAEAMAAAIEKGAEAARKAQERSDALKAQYGADPQQALIRAKRAQLYQNQLAAEALRVREEVAKQVKYLRRILRDTNVKAMGAPAADQIAALLERFEVAPVSLKRLDERKALATWLAEQEAAGLVPDIAPEVADEARRVNYQQLTVAEFRDLVDAIRQIEFIGKNERKVQLAAERAAYEEKRDEIVTRIRAVGRLRGVKFDPRSPLTNIGRAAAALRGFAAQHLKAASIARILDGGEDDGPLWTFAIRSANAAADMETRMRAEASAKLAEILAPVFALGNMGGKGVFFPSINRSLNREARLAIAMNVGNDGNRQRLLDGEGWTMEQVQPVLESLTEAEWKAVQQVWDYIDTYRPLIAEKERRLYGKEPEWVKPIPFTTRTADGREVRLEGGYYPIKYDPIASDRVATVDEAAEAKRALDGAYTAATTRRSFVKSRVREVVGRPLLYTLDAAFGGVNDVIHDLAWHEWLIQTQRLLRDPEFANAVRETRGPEYLKQLRDWAKDNAAGERKIGVAGEAALSWLRQGISASGLGFNVVSAAMQVTGFNQSIVRLGAGYVGRGVAQFAASPIDTARMVADKSSFMAERGRTQFREINEIRNRVRGQTEVARRVTAGTYFLMMNMQRTVDIPTWLAGYQKALDAGKDDATAVALADQAVRDTQGSGLISDLAAIERGGPVMKLFTVFYSYMNTVYNMTAVETMTARGKGKLAADYAMLLVVPVVLGQAIKNLIQPDAGDDELDPEALARKLAAEELSFLMGTMVIVREFGGAAQLLTGAEGVRMGYGGPAGLRAVGEVYGLATQAGQLEFDRAFRRSAINTLGAFTGLPSAQVNRTIDGIEAVIEGEVEGVGAVVAPFTGVQR